MFDSFSAMNLLKKFFHNKYFDTRKLPLSPARIICLSPQFTLFPMHEARGVHAAKSYTT